MDNDQKNIDSNGYEEEKVQIENPYLKLANNSADNPYFGQASSNMQQQQAVLDLEFSHLQMT